MTYKISDLVVGMANRPKSARGSGIGWMQSVRFDSMSPEGGEHVVVFQGSDALREDEVSNGTAERVPDAPRLRMRGGRDYTPASLRLCVSQVVPQGRGRTRQCVGVVPFQIRARQNGRSDKGSCFHRRMDWDKTWTDGR